MSAAVILLLLLGFARFVLETVIVVIALATSKASRRKTALAVLQMLLANHVR